MNIYEIITLSCGMSQSYIIQAYDAAQAISNNGISPTDVISLRLINSANKTDYSY